MLAKTHCSFTQTHSLIFTNILGLKEHFNPLYSLVVKQSINTIISGVSQLSPLNFSYSKVEISICLMIGALDRRKRVDFAKGVGRAQGGGSGIPSLRVHWKQMQERADSTTLTHSFLVFLKLKIMADMPHHRIH
jgi:hypothetical protein